MMIDVDDRTDVTLMAIGTYVSFDTSSESFNNIVPNLLRPDVANQTNQWHSLPTQDTGTSGRTFTTSLRFLSGSAASGVH